MASSHVQFEQVSTSRGQVACYVQGEGPPVLFIIGYLARWSAWETQIEAFSPVFKTLAFDHIGLGESTGEPAQSMQDFAQDCFELITHFNWQKVHVVGVSMGGMIAQEFALTYPQHVQSLTLIVTHPGGFRNLLPPLKGWPLFLKAQWAQNPRKRLDHLSRLLIPPARLAQLDRNRVHQQLTREFLPRPPSYVRLSHMKAIIKHNTRKRLSSLTSPTLIIQAQKDLLVHPKGSLRLHTLIPHSQLLSFAEAGHGVIRQVPSLINDPLLRFLQDHTPT